MYHLICARVLCAHWILVFCHVLCTPRALASRLSDIRVKLLQSSSCSCQSPDFSCLSSLTGLHSTDLRSALVGQNALLLGTLFNPTNSDYSRSFAYSSNAAQINEVVRRELGSLRSAGFTNNGKEIMIETVVAFWNVVYELERSGVTTHREHDEGYWPKVYAAQRTVMGLVCRGFNTGGWANWMLPMLYSTCRYLREFAMAADDEDSKAENASSLEDAARHLNKGFTLCLSDRWVYLSPFELSY